MNAIPFVIGTIAVFVIGYRLYFSFVAAKVAVRNDLSETPAFTESGRVGVPIIQGRLFPYLFLMSYWYHFAIMFKAFRNRP